MLKKNQVFNLKLFKKAIKTRYLYFLIILIQSLIIYLLYQKINLIKKSPNIEIENSQIDCGVPEIKAAFTQNYKYFSSLQSRYYYDINCQNQIDLKEENKIYFYSKQEAEKKEKIYKDCQ